jgi:hypothetical protein
LNPPTYPPTHPSAHLSTHRPPTPAARARPRQPSTTNSARLSTTSAISRRGAAQNSEACRQHRQQLLRQPRRSAPPSQPASPRPAGALARPALPRAWRPRARPPRARRRRRQRRRLWPRLRARADGPCPRFLISRNLGCRWKRSAPEAAPRTARACRTAHRARCAALRAAREPQPAGPCDGSAGGVSGGGAGPSTGASASEGPGGGGGPVAGASACATGRAGETAPAPGWRRPLHTHTAAGPGLRTWHLCLLYIMQGNT